MHVVNRPNRLFVATGMALGLITPFSASQAQIEEVTVTAQRISESVQDVPVAVTALTGDMLQDRQVINPSDLQLNAPNVSFTATNFGGSSFSIRGIGRLVIAASGENGVSTHFNEIPVGTNLNAAEFYDMERVEVLRGPQGTLFGRNATGGAINFITNKPDFEKLGGAFDFELGDYAHRRVKGYINVPLTDTFGLRFAGMKLDRDGYIDNLAFGQIGPNGETLPGIDDDVDGRDILSYRLTAEWQITDEANLWVMYSRFDENDDRVRITNQVCVTNDLPTTGCKPDEFGFQQPHLGSTTGGIFGGSAGALPFGSNGVTPTPGLNYDFPVPAGVGFRAMHTDYEPIFQNEEDLFAFGLTYDLEQLSFSMQGAYLETEYLSRQDYQMNVGPTLNPTALNPSGLWPTSEPAGRAGDDFRPGPCNIDDGNTGIFGGCVLPVDQTRIFAYDQSDSKSEYWTLEAKVSSSFDGMFNFLLGANAYDSESFGDYYVLANTLDLVTLYGSPALAAPPLYPGYFNNASNPNGGVLGDGWAVFGETYFKVRDNLKFTVGLRFNEDNKETSDTSVLFNAVNLNAILGGSLGPDPFWTRLTGFLLGGPGDDTERGLAAEYGVLAQLEAAATTAPLSAERLAVNAAVPITPQFGETRRITGSPSQETWREVSGRVGVDWEINDNSLLYAFFSRGYKPGGFNPAIPPAFQSSSSFTFDAEEVDSFEIGSKNTLFDNQLLLNGAFFIYDYSGLQVTRIANNSSINDNIDADIMGIEIEGLWRPESMPGLSVDFSYSWLDTEIAGSQSVDPVNRTAGNADWILLNNIDPGSLTAVNYIARLDQVTPDLVDAALFGDVPAALDIRNGQTVQSVSYPNGIPAYFSRSFLDAAGVETSDGLPTSLDGKQLPNSPEHTIHIGVAHTWAIDAIRGNLTARWDYYWQGESYAREFNTIGDEIDSWDQHNLSLIYESNDGHWSGRLWVRNVQDEDNVTGKYLTADTSGFYRNYFLTEPRIFGASVRYDF